MTETGKIIHHHHHHQHINVLTARAQAFLVDYTFGEWVITHHACPARVVNEYNEPSEAKKRI
jgi:hypothetical protein